MANMGFWVIKSDLYQSLKKYSSYWRNYVLCDSFIVTILFALTLASDMVVLYGDDAFSILALSTKKSYSSFLTKVFVFQKICFKVKLLKTFQKCYIKKHADLSKGELFWKSLEQFFRRTYALFVGFKMKPLRQSVFRY